MNDAALAETRFTAFERLNILALASTVAAGIYFVVSTIIF